MHASTNVPCVLDSRYLVTVLLIIHSSGPSPYILYYICRQGLIMHGELRSDADQDLT